MNPVHMECNITFSLFLNFFFEKFSVAHYPTLTLLPAQKKKKKKWKLNLEWQTNQATKVSMTYNTLQANILNKMLHIKKSRSLMYLNPNHVEK